MAAASGVRPLLLREGCLGSRLQQQAGNPRISCAVQRGAIAAVERQRACSACQQSRYARTIAALCRHVDEVGVANLDVARCARSHQELCTASMAVEACMG